MQTVYWWQSCPLNCLSPLSYITEWWFEPFQAEIKGWVSIVSHWYLLSESKENLLDTVFECARNSKPESTGCLIREKVRHEIHVLSEHVLTLWKLYKIDDSVKWWVKALEKCTSLLFDLFLKTDYFSHSLRIFLRGCCGHLQYEYGKTWILSKDH